MQGIARSFSPCRDDGPTLHRTLKAEMFGSDDSLTRLEVGA